MGALKINEGGRGCRANRPARRKKSQVRPDKFLKTIKAEGRFKGADDQFQTEKGECGWEVSMERGGEQKTQGKPNGGEVKKFNLGGVPRESRLGLRKTISQVVQGKRHKEVKKAGNRCVDLADS